MASTARTPPPLPTPLAALHLRPCQSSTHQAQEWLPGRLAVHGFPLKRLPGSWQRLWEEGEHLELLQNSAVLFVEDGDKVSLSAGDFK